jgi:hypothetical protein
LRTGICDECIDMGIGILEDEFFNLAVGINPRGWIEPCFVSLTASLGPSL